MKPGLRPWARACSYPKPSPEPSRALLRARLGSASAGGLGLGSGFRPEPALHYLQNWITDSTSPRRAEQRAAHYDKWNQERDPALVQWWNIQLGAVVNELVQNIRKDTWSLSLLAVSPHHRRKRIAHNLCRVVMDKALANEEGASVLTQSQDNVKVYERMGFSVFGHGRITGGSGGDYTIFSLTFNWPPAQT